MEIIFEQLPKAVNQLNERLENIEWILLQRNQQPHRSVKNILNPHITPQYRLNPYLSNMISYNDQEKSILLYLFEKKHTTKESSVPVSKVCEDLNLTPSEFNKCKNAFLTIRPAIIHPWVDAAGQIDNINIDQIEGSQWYEQNAPQFQPKENATIDRYKLTIEILELVNTSPLNGVDITSLIKRNSNGLDFQEQKSLRLAIKAIIRGFEEEGEMQIVDTMVNNIASSQSFTFLSNGGRIKSTYKYEKERQKEIEHKKLLQEQKDSSNHLKIEGGFHGTLIQDSEVKNSLISSANKNPKTLSKFTATKKIITAITVAVAAGLILHYLFHIG